MKNYPNSIKKLIREYHGKAYEKELHRELAKLDQSFAEWRDGEIDSWELSDRIHQYEVGPSRELYKQYTPKVADMNLAYAIVAGILDRDEIPTELLEALDGALRFYQGMKDSGDLRLPE
ncbi:MAG: hypothetical protein JXB30_12470 [Anaerolineae bacterium]|nr:hypothetical protein [Anaerolineae bacterium]